MKLTVGLDLGLFLCFFSIFCGLFAFNVLSLVLRSDCCNYRGITLLSVPGNVFSHVILARIRPTLRSHRRPQQSGYTPGHSTCDHIVTLNNTAQRKQDYGHPAFAAYVNLHDHLADLHSGDF